jgi:hypothetical protein
VRPGRPIRRAQERFASDPASVRNAALLMIALTLGIVLVGGLVVWVFDREDFPDLGGALWYTLQTVTTVGYGDIVPSLGLGRVVGATVMVVGVGPPTWTGNGRPPRPCNRVSPRSSPGSRRSRPSSREGTRPPTRRRPQRNLPGPASMRDALEPVAVCLAAGSARPCVNVYEAIGRASASAHLACRAGAVEPRG